MTEKKDVRIFYLIGNRRPALTFRKLIKNILLLNVQYLRRCFSAYMRPAGGVKTMFDHCELLNELGFCAKILLLGSIKIDWFKSPVDQVKIKNMGGDFRETDIIVCPQIMPYEGLKFKQCKKIIFAQEWGRVYADNLPEDAFKTYRELGYDKTISCSRYVTQYLRDHDKGESFIIPNIIDPKVFMRMPEKKENNRVLWLPRKNHSDGEKIVNIVKCNFPSVNFICVDNLKQQEWAAELQKADIFLATGYPEGFQLPPLEAMSCGCAVTGFTGRGGAEYMIDEETALVAEDGDVLGAARELVRLLRDKALKEAIREKGHNKAKEYSRERAKQLLRDFYEDFISKM